MVISVQLLRALAALMVVLHHIGIKAEQYHSDALSTYHIGYLGVDLFFIISGYIMCHSVAGKAMTFSRFISHRIKRIIPLYWLMTAAALVVYLLAPAMVNSSGGETSIFSSWTLIPLGDKLLVNNGWTLSYEFLFYLVFAAWLAVPSLNKLVIYSSLTLLVLVFIGICFHPQHPTLKFITSKIIIEFILGMLAFKILQRGNMPVKISLLLISAGLLALILQNQYGIYHSFAGRVLNGGVPMFLFFIGFVGLEPYINQLRFPGKKLCLLIGNASYSIYLIHPFLLAPGAKVLHKLHLINHHLLFVLLLLLSSVVAGICCWRFIEQPINAYFKRKNVAANVAKPSAA